MLVGQNVVALLVTAVADRAEIGACNHDVAAVERQVVFADAVEVDALERGGDGIGVIDGAGALHGGGEQIAFHSNQTGDYEIFAINADGTGLTNLTNGPSSSDKEPDWRRVSGAYPADYDGDGCPDYSPDFDGNAGNGLLPGGEVGPDELKGGLRSPQNPHDYFNPTQDGKNRVDDILATVNAYFNDDNDVNPGLPPYAAGYNPLSDRSNLAASPNAWNTGAPDGLQRVQDIVHALNSYFHDCS